MRYPVWLYRSRLNTRSLLAATIVLGANTIIGVRTSCYITYRGVGGCNHHAWNCSRRDLLGVVRQSRPVSSYFVRELRKSRPVSSCFVQELRKSRPWQVCAFREFWTRKKSANCFVVIFSRLRNWWGLVINGENSSPATTPPLLCIRNPHGRAVLFFSWV